MQYDEIELQNAFDALGKIISKETLKVLEHRFVRSYYTDYEYRHNDQYIFMKCDNENLLCEMLFYDMRLHRVVHTFAFRFTQCNAFFGWLEHFTKLFFKDSQFCKDKYGAIRISRETVELIESKMKDKHLGNEKKPYEWI